MLKFSKEMLKSFKKAITIFSVVKKENTQKYTTFVCFITTILDLLQIFRHIRDQYVQATFLF